MNASVLASYVTADRRLREFVAALILANGVPADLDAALALADALLAEVIRERLAVAVVQRDVMAPVVGSALAVADVRPYPARALQSVVLEAVGLHPRRESPAIIEAMDPETRKMARVRTAPYAMPDEPEIVEEVQRRLTAGTGRHVRQAGRELVGDTAKEHKLAWARTLSGAEDCGFCAMLASRGAVYASDTVKFRSHPNCDCGAELVRDPKDWPGLLEAEYLSAMWKESKNLATFTKNIQSEGDHVFTP